MKLHNGKVNARILALFLVVCIAAMAQLPSPNKATQEKPVDGVRIIEVLPSKLVVGKEQEVFVRVRYELSSMDSALLSIGFNSTDPARFRVSSREPVARGREEVVLSARVVPRSWGEMVFCQVFVSLGHPPQERRPALAVDHVPIPLIADKQ